MAIFGRRRASSNPRPSTTSTSSAATLAASQAFLANKASNANLSSAAATAALRSHTPTPTRVGQIQTKRMQRRNSLTAQSSAPGGKPIRPGGLQRRDSGGSMTERTFRSPSPNASQDRHERPASSHGPYPRYDRDDAPPVPALPKDYISPPQITRVKDRRPTSVEPLQRIDAPPPKQSDGRGVSLDRGPEVMIPAAAKPKTKKTQDSTGDSERASSRSSVNFSRPMSPQNSPPTSPQAGGRLQSPLAKTVPATGLADGEEVKEEASLHNTEPVPAKKKKKVVAKGSAGSGHLAVGTNGGIQPGIALEIHPQEQAPPTTSAPSPATGLPAGNASEAPQPKKKKKKKEKAAQSDESHAGSDSFGAAYPSDTDSVISERSSTNDRPRSYNTRAAGLLAKQPSIVREDREGEEKAEEILQGTRAKRPATSNGSVLAGTPANTSKVVSKDRQQGWSGSQEVTTQPPKLDVLSAVRHTSLSPGRAAHFSAQPINEGTKHQPPGRSVSPAKSALKNSPSRGHSPMVTRRGLAPGDASDSASQYSDDGSKSSSKKKKSARVSFDEEPVIVGHAVSPPLVPESPLIMSPQNKSAKTRTWIDLIREQNQGSVGSDQDDDSAIKPTPALPSFGSVRDRDPKSLSEADEHINPTEDRIQNSLRAIAASTDNAVGYAVAADPVAKQHTEERQPVAKLGPNDPVPPEVTSVEGSGYHSDEGDLFDQEAKEAATPQAPDLSQAPEPTSQSAPVASVAEPSSAHVPSIAVQPATPGMESALANRSSWLGMPGGFPSQKEGEGESTAKADAAEHQTPATVGIAEPDPEAVAAHHHSSAPVVGEVAQTLRIQIDAAGGDESEDSATDSIYSDAAEDQSDLEGDGFGSINAIVESPTSPNIGLAGRSPPASPRKDLTEEALRLGFVKGNESELLEPTRSEGWDRAQAYWSGLSQTRKEQLEQAALPGAIDEPIIRNRSMRGADAVHKKKKKKAKKVPPQPLGESDVLQQPLAPPPKSSMRPSSQVDSSPHLRSSMRDGPSKSAVRNGDKRNTMNQQPTPKAALQKKTRPVSAVAIVDYNRNAHISSPEPAQAAPASAPAVSKTVIRAQQQKQFPVAKANLPGAKSDSDSSPKKNQARKSEGKRYTMKRSMRGQSSELVPNRASSMSARTASPAESITRRPFSSIGPSGAIGMRTSMRGPVEVSKPVRTSLRNSMGSGKANRTKSPSRFSFIGSSKTKSNTIESKPTSRFSSRFGDSSEDEDLPTMASSRFADSSDDDDDEPDGLTPVRGIPRRINEGDSTDLDDSSEEKAPAPTKARVEANGSKIKQALPDSSPQGAALATGSLRSPSGAQPSMLAMGTGLQTKKAAEKEKKNRFFFGSLSGRKHGESSGIQKSDEGSLARREPERERTKADRTTVAPITSKSSGRVLGPSSSIADPVGMQKMDTASQTGSQTSATQNSPKSPRLQRRTAPKRITSSNDISWPLPQSNADPVDTPPRPRTSDGPAASNGDTRPRPSLVLRHSVQAPVRNPVVNGAASASADPNAKKKKFSMLRKAFGFHN